MFILKASAFANSGPACDYNQASAFVVALTGNMSAALNFRLIHDNDKSAAAIPLRGTLDQCWQSICNYNAQGYGAFVVINELDGNGNELNNVTAIRAHFIDLDNLSAQQNYRRAAQWSPAPSFAVQSSPNKHHVYWLVKPYSGNDRFTLIQRKLAQLFDADKSITDATRVMRLPGTMHCKNDRVMVTCHALAGRDQSITAETLETALAAVNLTDHSGTRRELGDTELSAPSREQATNALNEIDPNNLSRAEWISVTSAFKQSGWRHANEQELYNIWCGWCSKYETNDPNENAKQWNSIRNTEVGWTSLHRQAYKRPYFDPVKLFEGGQYQLPEQVKTQLPVPLDGYETIISTATGDSGKTTLIETVKILHRNMPVAFDEFTQTVMALDPLPWDKQGGYPRQWTDADTIHCQLHAQAIFVKPAKETVHDAITIIAMRHKYHQVRDYLDGLQWDGVVRLPRLMPQYFGTVDNEYTRTIGVKFMIGAVARVMKPGCKMDNVVILEGAQGKLKSSSIAALAGRDWFTDELPDLHTRDAPIQLHGKWIIEVSELSALRRSDVETIKKFMSRSVDRYRALYERIATDHPRQCIFIATTNDDDYLKDQTGNRRFWPVKCSTIDLAAISRDRNQLWAEAKVRYQCGETWWLTPIEEALAHNEQEERREIDPWEDRIISIATTMGTMPISMEYITLSLGVQFSSQDTRTNKRIAAVLKRHGFERRQFSDGGRRVRKYVKAAER